MRDYKHLFDDQDTKQQVVDVVSAGIALVILAIMILLICTALVDSVVLTSEIEEEKAKTWLAQTYDRPLAYRLQYPTIEQMERTEALVQLQPLVREQ